MELNPDVPHRYAHRMVSQGSFDFEREICDRINGKPRIIVAPDSFKDCLSASRIAEIISDEVLSVHPDWDVVLHPLSDGGEGFTELLTGALGGELVPVRVTGPLGSPVDACYGRVGETAVFGVSSACGLQLVPPKKRNPLLTTTRGVGELMLSAYRSGCGKMIIGHGGTATCDGGEGMMSVPGIEELCGKISVEALCDVDVPFMGPGGAVQVFAPQKGADATMLEILERKMGQRARIIREETGFDVLTAPGAGAGGGLAGAIMGYFGAAYRSGIDAFLEHTRFDLVLRGADLIITGEGRSDSQTLSGKAPMGVLCHSGGVPVVLLSGSVKDRDALLAAGFRDAIQVSPEDVPLEVATRPETAEKNIRAAVGSFLGRY